MSFESFCCLFAAPVSIRFPTPSAYNLSQDTHQLSQIDLMWFCFFRPSSRLPNCSSSAPHQVLHPSGFHPVGDLHDHLVFDEVPFRISLSTCQLFTPAALGRQLHP